MSGSAGSLWLMFKKRVSVSTSNLGMYSTCMCSLGPHHFAPTMQILFSVPDYAIGAVATVELGDICGLIEFDLEGNEITVDVDILGLKGFQSVLIVIHFQMYNPMSPL